MHPFQRIVSNDGGNG
ncbi:MAG: hypothetical protein IK089_08110 [Oxalobacter sp.]|nr:hypothetical protein [Oxalobacter sp.]